jgi:glycosyltransferase involved in cell wall biosynthesis
MRIAQIAPPWIPVPPVTYGGTELMVNLLVRGLRDRGVEVSLFCSGDSTIPVSKYGPYPKSFWPPDKFSENLQISFAWSHLRAHPPQVIHSHLENAAGFWAAAPLPAPLIITLHTPLTPVKQDYLKSFPQVSLVTVSDFQRRQLHGHPQLHLIPHGLDVNDYPFQAEKEDYLVFLGRIYADKGLHTAIQLAQETGRRLLIAGPVFPPDKPYFDQAIYPHLDKERIIYRGPADFQQKVELLSRAQALILPLEVDEAFGLVLLESMACGTPVLAYDRGAVREVVVSGQTGFVVPDFSTLREALTLVPRIKPSNCREHVEKHFSLDQMVESYLHLYRRLILKELPVTSCQ